MIRQFELVNKVKSYLKNVDEDALNKAYVFAMKAHGHQTRASGEPYFTHPLEVANILTDLSMDSDTIITALLHDTVEDTDVTLEDIRKNFGENIAALVDGVTKLSRIENLSDKANQAENFRKLLLAMSQDLRILLVKLADRLHNMRTLHHIKKVEKRVRISRETMEIYAPLAERIGLHKIKDELEDLAFEQLNADARDSILSRLHFLRREGGEIVEHVIETLEKLLKEGGIKAKIYGREKRPYSIWRKMRRQNIAFEQLTDIIAFRILVEDAKECYTALGIIHSTYPVIPNRFKDYISTPKPNGYRSIHTSVFGPKHLRLEVQIRTQQMHEIAENGVAAHWSYKQAGSSGDPDSYRWLRGLLDILNQDAEPEEFIDHTKMEMFQDQVFCFSPNGDLLVLPQGSTPLDFAYAVHSDIGNTCVSARINGKMSPLRTVLKNGDQVEITTSKTQTPSPNWERFVVTGKARSHIRRFLRQKEQEQYIKLGRSILQKALKLENKILVEKDLEKHLSRFKAKTTEDLFRSLGQGVLSSNEVLRALLKPENIKSPPDQFMEIDEAHFQESKKAKNQDQTNLIGLIPGMAVHFAKCCHPVPGDKIVGIVHTGHGVTVHQLNCPTLQEFEEEPDRWLDIGWDMEVMEDKVHAARLSAFLLNKPGSLAAVSQVISQQKANIQNFKILHRAADFYEVLFDIEVQNVEHLDNIIARLRTSSYVNSIERR